jgi:hypothetical protein
MSLVWSDVLENKGDSWGIPAGQVSTLDTRMVALQSAIAAIENNATRTPVSIAHCKVSLDALVTHMRYLKNHYFLTPPLTAEDLISLGLKPADGTRTPSEAPTTRPEAEIALALRQVTVHFRDEGSESRAKPKGAHACEIAWSLLDEPPASIADLIRTVTDTKTPHTFSFDETDRRKTMYLCLRWVGPVTGREGPWSEIYNATVP